MPVGSRPSGDGRLGLGPDPPPRCQSEGGTQTIRLSAACRRASRRRRRRRRRAVGRCARRFRCRPVSPPVQRCLRRRSRRHRRTKRGRFSAWVPGWDSSERPFRAAGRPTGRVRSWQPFKRACLNPSSCGGGAGSCGRQSESRRSSGRSRPPAGLAARSDVMFCTSLRRGTPPFEVAERWAGRATTWND